jgi:hypothetical protein
MRLCTVVNWEAKSRDFLPLLRVEMKHVVLIMLTQLCICKTNVITICTIVTCLLMFKQNIFMFLHAYI